MGKHKARRGSKRQRRALNKPERATCTSKGGTTKLRFNTQTEAIREANYQQNLFNRAMRTYHCDDCNGWHNAKRARRTR